MIRPKGEHGSGWLTTSEAAELLGVTRQRVWQLCKANRIPHKFFGCQVFITRRAISGYEAWVRAMAKLQADPHARKRKRSA